MQQQAVSFWENGRTAMSDQVKMALAQLLGQDPDRLFPFGAEPAAGEDAPPALLSMAQAAQYLGVAERTMKKLWQERRVTGVRMGRLVRFRVTDLDAYVDRHVVEAVR